MKIVIDTNIFISSFFWGGKPKKVLERVIAGTDELFISTEILSEIEAVMARPKFHVTKEAIEYYIKSIEDIGNKITPKRRVKNGSRDLTDNKFIECGLAANVDFIVSGDIHLLELKKYKNIKIISARDYLEIHTVRG